MTDQERAHESLMEAQELAQELATAIQALVDLPQGTITWPAAIELRDTMLKAHYCTMEATP